MANKRIFDLVSGAAPLSGAELLEIEQFNLSRKIRVSDIDHYTLYNTHYPINTILSDTKEPTGFVNRIDSVMSFNNTTRTFSISGAGGGTYDIYYKGKKITKSALESKQSSVPDGLKYFYFDSNGTLQVTDNFNETLITDNILISIIYWDSSNSVQIYFADERHGISMDGTTHLYLHETRGTVWEEGLGLGGFVADDTGDLNSHAQFSVAQGVIWDEDNNSTTLELSGGSDNWSVYYKLGTNGDWKLDDTTMFPVLSTGTGRAAWNQWTGAIWQLTEVTNSKFLLAHVFASNDYNIGLVNRKVIAVIGEAEYNSLQDAREAALSEIRTIEIAGLPFAEFVPIASVIYETKDIYSNSVKSRVRTTDLGDDYIDYRGITGGAVGGTSINDHGQLIGLMDDDHSQYILSNGSRAFTDILQGNLTLAGVLSAGDGIKSDIYTNDGIKLLENAPNVSGAWFKGDILNYDGTKVVETGKNFGSSKVYGRVFADIYSDNGDQILDNGPVLSAGWYKGDLINYDGTKAVETGPTFESGKCYTPLISNVLASNEVKILEHGALGNGDAWFKGDILAEDNTSIISVSGSRAESNAYLNEIQCTSTVTRTLVSGNGGQLVKTVSSFETVPITAGAAIVVPVNVPAGAKLIGGQLRVDSALAGGDNWDVAYSGGNTTGIATNIGVAKNTKVSVLLDEYAPVSQEWIYSTIQNTTSGTIVTLISNIPDNVASIEILLSGVSTNTNSQPPIIRLGDAGGVETTGYTGVVRGPTGETAVTNGIYPFRTNAWASTDLLDCRIRLTRWDQNLNTWLIDSIANDQAQLSSFSGKKTLSEALTTIVITTPGGTATFDAGQARVRYRRIDNPITSDITNMTITKNGGGSFTAQGSISGIVYYEYFRLDLQNLP